MTQDYSHYPLVKKALAEQQVIFKHFEGGIPEALKAATTRVLDLIETYVTDPEKEDMMAVAVLMHCPPYIMLKSKRFAEDYSLHVQAMLDTHTTRNGITAENPDLIQVYSAIFTAHGENLLKEIGVMTPDDKNWLADIREGLEEYLDDRRLVEAKIVPGLLAEENGLIRSTFAVIDAKMQKNIPNSIKKPPKPGAPTL